MRPHARRFAVRARMHCECWRYSELFVKVADFNLPLPMHLAPGP